MGRHVDAESESGGKRLRRRRPAGSNKPRRQSGDTFAELRRTRAGKDSGCERTATDIAMAHEQDAVGLETAKLHMSRSPTSLLQERIGEMARVAHPRHIGRPPASYVRAVLSTSVCSTGNDVNSGQTHLASSELPAQSAEKHDGYRASHDREVPHDAA